MQSSKNTARARVISIYGTVYICKAEQTLYVGVLAGRLRLNKSREKHPVVVGDQVVLEYDSENTIQMPSEEELLDWARNPKKLPGELPLIVEIEPRKNQFGRMDSRVYHVLGANLDQVLMLACPLKPPIHWNFLIRLLTVAAYSGIEATIVFNKFDLVEEAIAGETRLPARWRQEFKEWASQATGQTADSLTGGWEELSLSLPEDWFEWDGPAAESIHFLERTFFFVQAGYRVCFAAAEGGRVATVVENVRETFSLLVGTSGVGKSTLVNALHPAQDLQKTALISETTDKGRHTTTTALCIELPELNAQLVDTPGVKTWGVLHIPMDELLHSFPILGELSEECRFKDCRHEDGSKGCALTAGAEEDPDIEWLLDSFRAMADSYSDPLKIRKGDYWRNRR